MLSTVTSQAGSAFVWPILQPRSSQAGGCARAVVPCLDLPVMGLLNEWCCRPLHKPTCRNQDHDEHSHKPSRASTCPSILQPSRWMQQRTCAKLVRTSG